MWSVPVNRQPRRTNPRNQLSARADRREIVARQLIQAMMTETHLHRMSAIPKAPRTILTRAKAIGFATKLNYKTNSRLCESGCAPPRACHRRARRTMTEVAGVSNTDGGGIAITHCIINISHCIIKPFVKYKSQRSPWPSKWEKAIINQAM